MKPTHAVRTLFFAAAAAAASVAAPPASPLAAQEEDFRWTGRVQPGQQIEIEGVNGSIRAERAAGDEIEVTARKRARRSDPEEVTIEVIEHADGVTVCALYPTPERAREENSCAPGGEGRMRTERNDVSVEFTVRVPDGVRLRGRTVNGGIDARGLTADADLASTNGSIRVETTGLARARTTNGSIDVVMGAGAGTEDLDFSTTNGAITVEVAGELNATVRAATTNGDLTSDFPITVQGTFGPRRLEGVIGSGGRRLSMRTTNGDITLRRAGL